MRCAWKALLDVLPIRLRKDVDRLGQEQLQELRLRINAPPELVLWHDSLWLEDKINGEDLNFVVNMASRYSPWCAQTLKLGYITAPGGHRIGVCGEAAMKEGAVFSLRQIHSLCIRVARDYSGIVKNASELTGNILILGPPGWGKTTLLRDLTRQLSQWEQVAIVDERGELFPEGFSRGKRMDVLLGCPKNQGIEMLLRTMGPDCIAVDEITAEEDCNALIRAANCGVRLVATAHASSKEDFLSRKTYRALVNSGIINSLLILRRDKTYQAERMIL